MSVRPDERMVDDRGLCLCARNGWRCSVCAPQGALDREALIEAGAAAVHEVESRTPWAEVRMHDQWLAVSRYKLAEAVLRAVGLIA